MTVNLATFMQVLQSFMAIKLSYHSNTSMKQEVLASDQSMPMTLHFAILEF
jgi:hypothetical protein